MWPHILIYVPRSKGHRKPGRAASLPNKKADRQYRRRRLPVIPEGFWRGYLWLALLAGAALLAAVTDKGL